MKIFGLFLALLVVLIQYPLWVGRGGWLRVWELDQQLIERRAQNERLQARNGSLEAEVRDLKNGLDAIEERARFELGMIRADEVFILIPAALSSSESAKKGDAKR
ncbi:MAG: cell division protein FtsB [Betaproteobacteria bacterium]|nr:cell division protein FtsB [Betaproteobacteria bacterium]